MTSVAVHSIPASLTWGLTNPSSHKLFTESTKVLLCSVPSVRSGMTRPSVMKSNWKSLPSNHCTWHNKSAQLLTRCGGPFSVNGDVVAPTGGGLLGPEEPQWGSAQTGERLEWWGWPNEGCMGVGVGSMCPEWLKGGRWPMWAMWLVRPGAPPKGEALSCMHFDSSSKPSPARLFLLDLLDILRLRVWMPSFFMVRGLLTCWRAAH